MTSRGPYRSVWRRLLSFAAPRRATPADITHLHQLLLDRDPRPGELAAYARDDILRLTGEIARSWEHRDRMRAALISDVARLYRDMLHREPESDEVVRHRVGRPLLDLAMEFAHTDEFRARARTTTSEDVILLYRRLLDRQPENAAAITSRVGLPLLDAAIEIVQSPEARARQELTLDELQEWCTVFLGGPIDEAWARLLLQILRDYRLRRVALLDHLLRMHLARRGVTEGGTGAPWRVDPPPPARPRAHDAPTGDFARAVTLVIPTIDSEPWIGAIAHFYEEMGVRPLFAVDSRTCDRTRDVLTRARQDWIEVSATARRVEALLPDILRRTNTPWILRLDDDEVPTLELLRFCEEVVGGPEVPVWGFPRLCLRWDPGRGALDYSTFLTVGPHVDMDRQWRLFRPADVKLSDGLHTPGFESEHRMPAAPDALILHFDWVIRSTNRRRTKMASYEMQAGSASHPRLVLYEAIPDEWHQFQPLRDPRFADLARQVHQSSR